MPTQFVEVSSGNTSLPSSLRDDDPSIGVPPERIDPHTLEVIQLLFKERGLLFLAQLLRLAKAKQHALPGLGTTDCAVITARNIRELAKHIQWGYDTTEKYLVVFCALHLLYKGKSPDDEIAYYFPLNRYAPAAPDALESIIQEYRNKVQSFARKAKRRFLVYLEQQKSTILPLASPASLPSFDLSGAEADIEQIMLNELGNGVLPQRLMLKLKGALRYRCQMALDQTSIQTDDSGDFPSQKSSFSEQKGDSFVTSATANGRLPEQKGDFPSGERRATHSEKSPISQQKGDFSGGNSLTKGQLSPPTGDALPKIGDSEQNMIPNVNVILRNYIGSINVNVSSLKEVIEYLRTTFDETPAKRGYYYNLYKQYKQPEAWLAATIETLIVYHKKATDQPGKYFYDLCVIFHKNGIPQEVAVRMQQYGDLTQKQLLALLDHPPVTHASPSVATRPAQSHHPSIVPRVSREKNRPGLSSQEVQQVIDALRSDERICTATMARYRQTDGSSALLVDNGSTTRPRQIWIYSLQECQRRLTRMMVRNDFFQNEGKI